MEEESKCVSWAYGREGQQVRLLGRAAEHEKADISCSDRCQSSSWQRKVHARSVHQTVIYQMILSFNILSFFPSVHFVIRFYVGGMYHEITRSGILTASGWTMFIWGKVSLVTTTTGSTALQPRRRWARRYVYKRFRYMLRLEDCKNWSWDRWGLGMGNERWLLEEQQQYFNGRAL
jgi:hypothetical protein